MPLELCKQEKRASPGAPETPAGSRPGTQLEVFQQLGQALDAQNVGLDLQTLFHLSGQPVVQGRVRELTHILEEAKDPRTEKGRKLLAQLEAGD